MGIKMDSNKHGSIEQNKEHILMNILIYHKCKTDLRMRSYGMMNRAIKCYRDKDLEIVYPPEKSTGTEGTGTRWMSFGSGD